MMSSCHERVLTGPHTELEQIASQVRSQGAVFAPKIIDGGGDRNCQGFIPRAWVPWSPEEGLLTGGKRVPFSTGPGPGPRCFFPLLAYGYVGIRTAIAAAAHDVA